MGWSEDGRMQKRGVAIVVRKDGRIRVGLTEEMERISASHSRFFSSPIYAVLGRVPAMR